MLGHAQSGILQFKMQSLLALIAIFVIVSLNNNFPSLGNKRTPYIFMGLNRPFNSFIYHLRKGMNK